MGGHDILTDDYIGSAVEHLEKHPKAVLVYPRDAIFVDKNNLMIRDGACSNIESRNNISPVSRMAVVVKNLSCFTNIHGVFLTAVAKKLPFEKVIGPDNLQLAVTALFGEIHSIPIQGIRRKEVREETSEESRKRWAKLKIFGGRWGHLYFLTNYKQFLIVIKSKDLSFLEKMKYFFILPGVFRWRSCFKQFFLTIYSSLFRRA